MTDSSRVPNNKQSSSNPGELTDLSVAQSRRAVAFARSGLGEEVLPGFFILQRDLALAVTALQIRADPTFLAKEVELAQDAYITGAVAKGPLLEAATDLLARMADKVDIQRGVFLVGGRPTVATNLLKLALPELPQFARTTAQIQEIVDYVAQPNNVFVTEGAQFEKKHLFYLILWRRCLGSSMETANLALMYGDAKDLLEKSPEILGRLQRDGIVPEFCENEDILTFWSKVFSSSNCRNNRDLMDWACSKVNWPEKMKNVSNDGLFLVVLLSRLSFEQHAQRPDATMVDKIRHVELGKKIEQMIMTCFPIAEIVDEVAKASRARVARAN